MPVRGLEQVRVGGSKENGFKLWTVRENCSVGSEQEGCSGQGEPDQRTSGKQSPKFAQETVVFVWTTTESPGPSEILKTKVAILKTILSLTGSQWSALSSRLTCSWSHLRKTTFIAWFWTLCNLQSDHSWCQWAKCCSSPTDWEQKNTSAEQWLLSSGDGG